MKTDFGLYGSLRDGGDLFIAEGIEVVSALLRSKLEVRSILMEEQYVAELEVPAGIELQVEKREALRSIVGYKMHQGIMALGVKPKNVPLSDLKGPAVVLNGLANAENVGVIVRNARAFGFENLIVDRECSPPYLRRSIKVSRGALFEMKVHETADLPHLLALNEGIATCLEDAVPLPGFTPPKDGYYVFGREGTGIDRAVMDACKHRITIPISHVDSLNVSVASGIVLYYANIAHHDPR